MWHLLGLALLLTFGVWMVSLVVSGVRTGRIRHTDLTSTYALREQPLRFVFVAVVFLAFAALGDRPSDSSVTCVNAAFAAQSIFPAYPTNFSAHPWRVMARPA